MDEEVGIGAENALPLGGARAKVKASRGLGSRGRAPLGKVSNNLLRNRNSERSEKAAKAKLNAKSRVQAETAERKPRLPRSVPRDVAATRASEDDVSTSFSKDLPHSPTNKLFRKNVLQDAILSNAERVSGSSATDAAKRAEIEGRWADVASIPPSPSDVIFKKNLRREAIILSAKSTSSKSEPCPAGRGAEKGQQGLHRLPPSPSDILLHQNLRQAAITRNAQLHAPQDLSQPENLASKFDAT